jgi:membrane-bound lytic murein transglycosylase B
MKIKFLSCLCLALIVSLALPAEAAKKKKAKPKPAVVQSTGYEKREDVQAFIVEAAAELQLDAAYLRSRFSKIKTNDTVIRLMNAPVQKPAQWHEYAPRFLQAERIQGGVNYVRQQQAWFDRAEETYQVPASVIAAIIGVETYYGRVTGTFDVFEALATLTFDYPRRAVYFRGELKNFLAQEKAYPALFKKAKGSYAGAMGLPQFMPGSYRNFAVDFDQNQSIDLWQSPADIIGSVGAYFVAHGWEPNGLVMLPVTIKDPAPFKALENNLSERQAVSKWIEAGVSHPQLAQLPPLESAGLVLLEETPVFNGQTLVDNPQYFLVFNNFYVITRYNRSRLYASAVWGLAQAIQAKLKTH